MNKVIAEIKYYLSRMVLFSVAWFSIYFFIIPLVFGIRDVGLTYWVFSATWAFFPAAALFLLGIHLSKEKSKKLQLLLVCLPFILGYPLMVLVAKIYLHS
jgi:hypothetical protein